MPGEHLSVEVRIVAGRLEANDHTFPVLLHIFYQVIHLKGLSIDRHDRIILGVDLPVAVVIVDIQILDCLFGEALPPLQADQQSLHIRVEMREIQVADEILYLEGVVDNRINLLLVPFLEIGGLELYGLLGHLLEDAGVVAQRVGGVLEVQEPEAGLKAELVEQEGPEVDVEVAVGVDGKVEVVLRDLDGTLFEEVGVVVLEDMAGEQVDLGIQRCGVGEQVEVPEVGEQALGVHDVHAVPLVGVEAGEQAGLAAEFLHLEEVVHLRQHQVQVQHNLVVLAALARVRLPQLQPHLRQVVLLEVRALGHRIAEEVEQPNGEGETVQDSERLGLELLLAAGNAANLLGLGGLADVKGVAEELSLIEENGVLGNALLAGPGLSEVDAQLAVHLVESLQQIQSRGRSLVVLPTELNLRNRKQRKQWGRGR